MINATQAERLTPAQEIQARARELYLSNLREGYRMTGAELGTHFERGERWGQERIAEVQEAARTSSPVLFAPDATGSLPPVTTPPNAESAEVEDTRTLIERWRDRKAARRARREQRKTQPSEVAAPAPPARARQPKPATIRPQRRGASGVAWLAFGLGIIVSVAANVGHIWFVTRPEGEALYAAMVLAAFWPLALAISVEVISRVRYPLGVAWAWARFGGIGAVGAVAAIVSYLHMHSLLRHFGESQLSAIVGPLGVDGLLIVGGYAIFAIGETKRPRE